MKKEGRLDPFEDGTITMKPAAFENVKIEEEPETKAAPVASPEKKIRPTTPVNNADYEKKEKQRAKFMKVQEKVEAKK